MKTQWNHRGRNIGARPFEHKGETIYIAQPYKFEADGSITTLPMKLDADEQAQFDAGADAILAKVIELKETIQTYVHA